MTATPTTSSSPLGSSSGWAIDVIVVAPSPKGKSANAAGGGGGVAASSDFYASFPSSLVKSSFTKSLKSFGSRKSSSNLSTSSTSNSSSSVVGGQVELITQVSSSTPKGNVQVRINGRYISKLDMIFSNKNTSSCRFVHGNGLRPSVETLKMIIEGTVDIHEDEGKITCTCSEAVKNSEHHLCAQNSGSSREGQSKEPVLKSGRNLIRYTLVSEKGVAIASAEANIYLWSALDSVIVSDIDGTVTKDNVGGVIDTVVQEKYEHIHNGICKFFQQLAMISPMEDMGDLNETDNKKGQVRFMYLTSRPISYVNTTRKLLVSVSQTCEVNEELHTLPPGPMMCNTIPLTSVLYSELIAKNTHMFKSDVLARQVVLPFVAARGEDWRKVKKVNSSRTLRVTKLDEVDEDVRSSSDYIDNRSTRERSGPIDDRLFLAGFGNNMRDAMAYEMAGMDRNDIYIINSKSRIMCIGERGQSQNLDEINSECFETEWISDVVDSCCLGKSEMPGGELNGENPQGLAYESKIKSQSNSQVVFNCPSIHQPINQSANKSKKGGDSVSKSKKSIRAFTNKKSFTRFPSFTSSSSGTSSSSTKTLYQGYDDPRLLEKVRRRMQGIHYSLLSQT